MGLRKIWLAISTSKSTVMFSSTPSNAVLQPLADSSKRSVRLVLGFQPRPEQTQFWLAISQEDGLV